MKFSSYFLTATTIAVVIISASPAQGLDFGNFPEIKLDTEVKLDTSKFDRPCLTNCDQQSQENEPTSAPQPTLTPTPIPPTPTPTPVVLDIDSRQRNRTSNEITHTTRREYSETNSEGSTSQPVSDTSSTQESNHSSSSGDSLMNRLLDRFQNIFGGISSFSIFN